MGLIYRYSYGYGYGYGGAYGDEYDHDAEMMRLDDSEYERWWPVRCHLCGCRYSSEDSPGGCPDCIRCMWCERLIVNSYSAPQHVPLDMCEECVEVWDRRRALIKRGEE